MNSTGLLMIGNKGLTALKYVNEKSPELLQNIHFVVVGTDKNVQDDYSEQILSFCESKNIPTFKRVDFPQKTTSCDWLIAIGWKWLIDTDKENLIVLHDSLLPKYRGFNPLVTALIEGDKEIGVTAIEATDEMDAGPIVSQRLSSINYPIKIESAIEKVSGLYGEVLQNLLSIDLATAERRVQEEDKASYSLWRNNDDYWVDWSLSSDRILRFIDAVGFPYLGASTRYNGEKIIIHDAEGETDLNIVNRTPGKIFSIQKNEPVVVCGDGMIRIKEARDINGELFQFKSLRVQLQ